MIVYRERSSLTKDLGIPAYKLYLISNSIARHYHKVEIPKGDGGVRRLSVPDEALKDIQRRIAAVLLPLEPISSYATAYAPGSDILKNAALHVGKSKVLKLDIKHFFDSILYSQVKEKAFPAFRYSEENRVLLSMLCYHKDSLPQGAPTSPAISNIIMYDFDEKIGKWCKERNITYTRYCDDMIFSGDFKSGEVIKFVAEELKKYGFFLNSRKTSISNLSKRQSVTGLVVNEKPNTSKEYRRKLRQEVYFCRRFGAENHLKRMNCEMDVKRYLVGLYCRLSFASRISPDNKKLSEDKSYIKGLLFKK